MVVLSSCSNRCARDAITKTDVSVRDRLSVTQNMPLSCEFCMWISLGDVIFQTEGSMIMHMHSISLNIYRHEISLTNKEDLAVFTPD